MQVGEKKKDSAEIPPNPQTAKCQALSLHPAGVGPVSSQALILSALGCKVADTRD